MSAVKRGSYWLFHCGCGVLVVMFVVYSIATKTDLGSQYYHQLRKTADRHSENYHSQLTVLSSSFRPTTNKTIPGGILRNSSVRSLNYSTERAETTSILTTATTASMLTRTSHLPPSTPSLNSSHSAPTHDYTPPPLSGKFTALRQRDIQNVKVFVIFVGFARSGHSIVGTLMDAHPDMVIAHEYNVLKNIKRELRGNTLTLFNNLYRNSYSNAMAGWRSRKKSEKGYNLSMTRQSWQGRVHTLRVIGDKAAGMAAQQHHSDPTKCAYLVKGMKAQGISVKAIRVLRNPYDIISTRTLYKGLTNRQVFLTKSSPEYSKQHHPMISDTDISRFFELASHVNGMIADCQLPVLNVHLSDLVSQPRAVMKEICNAMGVECPAAYLDSCAGKVFKTLSKTRNLVKWQQKKIDVVAQKMTRFSEFSRYSYDC